MIVEFSVVPVGGGEELAGPVVEGEWGEVLGLIRRCHEAMRGEAARVLTHIAIDDRAGASGRIEGKVRDVEAVLGRDLKK